MLNKTQRMTGTVKWYDKKKGFGFITSDMNSADVFLHHTALQPHEDVQIVPGDRITFTIQKKEKGLAALGVKRFAQEKELDTLEEKRFAKKNKILQSNQISNGINFTDLNLNSELLHAIRDAGYVNPTPIQVQAIPIVLKGQDLLGCAQTGTGKTAAFALPTLQRLSKTSDNQNRSNVINNNKKRLLRRVRVLVLAPTRELAIQIEDSFNIYGKYTAFKYFS